MSKAELVEKIADQANLTKVDAERALNAFIKNNFQSYLTFSGMMLVAVLLCGGSTWAFQEVLISPKTWMLSLGIGLFLPYLLIQTVVFERLIALFKARGNVGFLVYICDSVGYLGSVVLLIYREFFLKKTSFLNILITFSYVISLVCFILLIVQLFYFSNKYLPRTTTSRKLVTFGKLSGK
jgi:hypothetical protein